MEQKILNLIQISLRGLSSFHHNGITHNTCIIQNNCHESSEAHFWWYIFSLTRSGFIMPRTEVSKYDILLLTGFNKFMHINNLIHKYACSLPCTKCTAFTGEQLCAFWWSLILYTTTARCCSILCSSQIFQGRGMKSVKNFSTSKDTCEKFKVSWLDLYVVWIMQLTQQGPGSVMCLCVSIH